MRATSRHERQGIVYLRRRRKGLSRPLVALICTVALAPALLTSAVAVGAVYAGYSYYTATVHAADLGHLHPYSFQNARIYDRHGVLLYEVGDPTHGERRPDSCCQRQQLRMRWPGCAVHADRPFAIGFWGHRDKVAIDAGGAC